MVWAAWAWAACAARLEPSPMESREPGAICEGTPVGVAVTVAVTGVGCGATIPRRAFSVDADVSLGARKAGTCDERVRVRDEQSG